MAGIVLEALCMGVINFDEALVFAENNWKKMHGFGTWKCRGGKFLKKKYRKSMWLFKGNLKWGRVMDIYCEKLSDLADKTYKGTKYEFGVRVWNRKGRKGCYYTFGGGYETYIMHELNLVCGEEKEVGMKWV